MQQTQESFKDRQKKNKDPLQYSLYKGVTGRFGALRLNLKKAYQDTRRDKHDGCIFLEMAPATGPNVYDWENSKIIMALTITDIPKILLYLRAPKHSAFKKSDGKLKIYHDRGAGTNDKGKDTTTIELNKPDDRDNIFISAYQKRGNQTKSATVSISPDETVAMAKLLDASIPLILAWD
jgi:hypothetical protein